MIWDILQWVAIVYLLLHIMYLRSKVRELAEFCKWFGDEVIDILINDMEKKK